MSLGSLRHYFAFGILQRYVMGEVVRSFVLAALTITAIFVLLIVMAEASRNGLTPQDILHLIPFIIPSSLPYTMPVALLFSVTVVYGRLAADNEVVAVKTAGLSAMTLLVPSFLVGTALSALLWALSIDAIPSANHRAKKIIFNNLEDLFYKQLKQKHEFDNPGWPFFIRVNDVDGRTMIGAVFKHRTPRDPSKPPGAVSPFDMTVQSRKARISFDIRPAGQPSVARIDLEGAEIRASGENPDWVRIDEDTIEIPLPDNGMYDQESRIQELTNPQIVLKQASLRKKKQNERKKQAVAAGMWIASGRIDRVSWPHIQAAFLDYQYWDREFNELETEKHMRSALACGSFFFVLLGAPVGVRAARRDFLSAFITCFVPIILLYYPLTLAGVNLGKEGLLNPMVALWIGNAVLGFIAGFLALPPVIKH